MITHATGIFDFLNVQVRSLYDTYQPAVAVIKNKLRHIEKIQYFALIKCRPSVVEPDSLFFPWQQSRQKCKIAQRKATRSSLNLERAFTRNITGTGRVAVHKAMQTNMKRIWKAKFKPRNTKKSYRKSENERFKLSNYLEI